jgi:hypothetical protein
VSDVNQLSPPRRAKIYRMRAAELVRKARNTTSERLKTTYLNLAASWQELAVTLERLTGSDRGGGGNSPID